jgi:uncharacterized protein YpmS
MLGASNSLSRPDRPSEGRDSLGSFAKRGHSSGGEGPSAWNRARRVLRTVLGIFLIMFCLGALLALAILGVLYRALAYVPEFYQVRTQWSGNQIEEYHRQFLERFSLATNELKKRKTSEIVFREDELNGWIEIEGKRLIPADATFRFVKPRIQLTDKAVWVATELHTEWAKGVAWAVLEPEVRGPNVIAIRIREARLGRVPLPTNRLIQYITSGLMAEVLRGSRAGAYWEISEGRPVLVLHLDLTSDPQSVQRFQIENLRVGEGILAIRVAEGKGS